jgi:hypothetical protein
MEELIADMYSLKYQRKSVVDFFFKSLPIHRIRDKTRMTFPSRMGLGYRIKEIISSGKVQ